MSIRSKINSSLNNLTLSSSFKNLDLNGGNEVLKYSAEEIASQLTLIDVTAFKSIRREELSSLSWNTSRKMQMTPNLVSFTRLFNKVSFWVIEEILFADRKVRTCIDGTAKQRNIDIDGPKCRGEVITHFIRIAKRLFDLNNIHSCYAVISALSSSSIYRLSKSWNFVGKKDKAIFDKLSLLLTDENNFEALRMHLSAVKSDCIPYLGMYLRDLVYTDIAHPVSPGLQNTQRTIKLDKIINTVIGFQESTTYDFLTPIAHIKKYLNSVNYIEELQKFLEEDNFK
ncbi:ras-specific guanine nucleotide-releasing factor RalGPS1-like isoform X3 [Dinothrombium tinctorium]|nr:ras-specific guanine nucleotide-releasing factor RalGPS1-like isoform X3 [Dinothrombium tinctorium]